MTKPVDDAIHFDAEVAQLRNIQKKTLKRITSTFENYLNHLDKLEELGTQYKEIEHRNQLRESSGFVKNTHYQHMHHLPLQQRQQMERMQEEDKLDSQKLVSLSKGFADHDRFATKSLSRISDVEEVLYKVRGILKTFDKNYEEYDLTESNGEYHNGDMQEDQVWETEDE